MARYASKSMNDSDTEQAVSWCPPSASTENGVFEPLREDCGEHDFRKAMIPLPPITEITTVEEANDAHRRIKQSLNDAIGLGKFLSERKAELGHGAWGAWCRANLIFSERTAQRYMLLYADRAKFASKNDTVSDLSISSAYKQLTRSKVKSESKKDEKKQESIKSDSSYKQFADAVATLKSLDSTDSRYLIWVHLLEELISDMRSRVSEPLQDAA